MARKFLYVIAAIIVLVLAGAFAYQRFGNELIAYASIPNVAFEEKAPLKTGIYDAPDMWLARGNGGTQAMVRFVPKGFDGEDSDALNAAVFFVHPTSYLATKHWNAPLDDAESQGRAQLFVRAMASPFARAGEVWVPKYRQAAFGAFLTDKPEGQMALNAAYQDVEQAFDAFLAEVPPSRPIVLAGHSQGSLHLLRLMNERVAGTPLAKRVVAVYAIGWPIDVAADLPALGMPACAEPSQTGCVFSYSSFALPADYSMVVEKFEAQPGLTGETRVGGTFVCTNPLSGGVAGDQAMKENLGTVVPDVDLKNGTMQKGLIPARCDAKGILIIGDPPEMGPYVLPGNNYHVYDIPLYWRNLRADVERRVRAWK
jgi:Protein of unknown function (DUF3089)